ncbi:hypothetical protein HYU96_02120 [Candidatus Daviesbacteria bacterium]|nr:hypothetical protein [Candidatus Daviesbacteria bacterium]
MEKLRNLGTRVAAGIHLWREYSNAATGFAEEAQEVGSILDELAARMTFTKMIFGTVETAIGIGLIGSTRFIRSTPFRAFALIIGSTALLQAVQDHRDWIRALNILDRKGMIPPTK